MSNAHHTPGPWKISDTSIVTDRNCIAVIEESGGYQSPPEERTANARLISAAPCLLEACQIVIEECEDTFFDLSNMSAEWQQILRVLRAAVAKATGEEVPSA